MSSNFVRNNPKLCALAKLGFKVLKPTISIALLAVIFSITHKAYLAFPALFLAATYIVIKDILASPYGLTEYLQENKEWKEYLAIALIGLVFGIKGSIFWSISYNPPLLVINYWTNIISSYGVNAALNIFDLTAGMIFAGCAVLIFQFFIISYKWATKTYLKYLEECKST